MKSIHKFAVPIKCWPRSLPAGRQVQWIAPIAIGGSFLPFPNISKFKMYFVYVIRSLKNDSFYIGRTANLSERLNFHNSTDKNVGVTRMNIPWEYFFVLEVVLTV